MTIECIILTDGNTIICETDHSSNHIKVRNPITINVGVHNDNIHLFVDKYAKFTNDPISINENHIVSRYEPTDNLKSYYLNTLIPNVNESVDQISNAVFNKNIILH